MNEKKTYLSQEKHDELTKELDFLKNKRRMEIAQQLEEAKAFGDLSENAEYHQAREAQAIAEGRIRELEALLKSAEIVSRHKSDTVTVGSVVTVKRDDGTERTFEIVGSEEADTKAGKISPDSPLGLALMGKKKDEKFFFKTPAGKSITYTVLSIE